jgi:hypothetical protein
MIRTGDEGEGKKTHLLRDVIRKEFLFLKWKDENNNYNTKEEKKHGFMMELYILLLATEACEPRCAF